MRAFEVLETRAHASGDREVRDLGDCVLLHAPSQEDLFFNRVGAVRWPDEPDAFDRRLGEVITVFAGLDRRPHVWTPPAFRSPGDLEDRLRANGFRAAGDGAYVMVREREVPPARPATGVAVELVRADDARVAQAAWTREVALVLARSFGFSDEELPAVERDVATTSALPGMTTVVVRDGGEALAVGRAYTGGGLSYLLSIGTDPLAAGRGHGTLVTTSLAADAAAAGAGHVFLAVRTQNDRAVEMYRRAGFEIVGEPAGELVLG